MTRAAEPFRRRLVQLHGCILLLLLAAKKGACQQGVYVDALVPADYEVLGQDQYVCFRVDLPPQSLKIVGVDPLSTQDVVHHMLLFGCSSEGPPNEAWGCHMVNPCREGSERVLYGWGKNAPAMSLPKGVGYSIGPGSAIRSLVLQVHYLQARPPGDESGIRLRMTTMSTPYSAGMINYAKYFTIPPGQAQHPIENTCCYQGFETLQGFAFRVHTHALGRSVNLERVQQRLGQDVSEELCRGDPQLPQGFTPLKQHLHIRPGDTLKATCMFDSSQMKQQVNAGATHNDEMCNLYLMLYSQLPFFMACYGSSQVDRHGMGGIPAEGRLELDLHMSWQPPEPIDLPKPLPTPNDPQVLKVGQVSAVAKGIDDDIWVFHRGQVVWDERTFSPEDDGRHVADPEAFVRAPAVVQLNQDTGAVSSSWGENRFLMPHGLTVDFEGNIWVTDVGLHQAFKFDAAGHELLTLGVALKPGSDDSHLCKPTHVVVANDGTIFVADGYCNSRVVRYGADAQFEVEYILPRGKMDIPHSLVLDECDDALYVADREHSEVHKFSISNQRLQGTWNLKQSGYVYSITAGPYGTVLALCWAHRENPLEEEVNVVLLSSDSSGGAEQTWRLEGVGSSHDLAITASPMPIQGTGDRTIAVYVAETKPSGSMLRKFLFVPAGMSMDDMVEAGVSEGKVVEELIPQGHGVEAHLAQAQMTHDGSTEEMPNVSAHKLSAAPSFAESTDVYGATTHQVEALDHSHGTADQQLPAIAASDNPDHAVSVHDEDLKGHLPGTSDESDVSYGTIEKSKQHTQTVKNGVFGHQSAVTAQNRGALSQLFSFGLPFVGIFAVAAVLLWKRLGDVSSHQSVV